MYTLEQQEKRALPEFLYDDFIRVFCGPYMDYVRKLDVDSPVVRMIHWYNENVPTPVYLRGIVTRKNIDSILARYSDEYRAIKREIEEDFDDGATSQRDEPVVPTSEPRSPIRVALDTPEVLLPEPTIHADELASDPIEVVGNSQPHRELPRALSRSNNTISPRPSTLGSKRSASRLSGGDFAGGSLRSGTETPKIRQPRPTQRPASDASNHMPYQGPKQTPRPTAAIPRFAPTQQSNPESIPETLPRPRQPPRPSNGGPPATGSGSGFKARKSTGTIGTTKVQRWKQFLANTISSSVPGNSSAQ